MANRNNLVRGMLDPMQFYYYNQGNLVNIPRPTEYIDGQEFTADGQMIMEGESNSYSHSGNTLTITEDGETETNTCTVTSTNMVVIINDTEEEDGMTLTSNITLNHTRQ